MSRNKPPAHNERFSFRHTFVILLLALLLASCGNNRQQADYRQDMTVFAYLPSAIDTIRVTHRLDTLSSFTLIHEQDTVWTIKPLVEQSFNNLNNNLLRRYLSYYGQVVADSIVTSDNKELTAIVDHTHWQYGIYIGSRQKNCRTVQIYGIPSADGQDYDTDKCLIYIVETKEIMKASWISFDILLKKFQDFVEKK